MSVNDDRNDELPERGADNPQAGESGPSSGGPLLVVPPEDYPDVSDLITEDDAPMESAFLEKQYKLLTEPLESSWAGPPEGGPFIALTNVGLFAIPKNPPLVPDFMLSLGVSYPPDPWKKEHRSYFVWEYGKPPDTTLEIVSDKLGGEATHKMQQYARMRVLYYVIYDPLEKLSSQKLRVHELRGQRYHVLAENRLEELGLSLTFWRGNYGGMEAEWLRWCDRDGNLIPTGKERADEEKRRADEEKRRADELAERIKRLEAQLRAAGQQPMA